MTDVENGEKQYVPAWHALTEVTRRTIARLAATPWITPLSVAWGSRFALYLLLFAFVGLLPGEANAKPDFWTAISAWDGEWYLRIAREGYQYYGPNVQSAIVFWPLYPILGRMAAAVVGDLNWGFLLVTTASFFAFIYYLYRLAALDFSTDTAERAIVYAALFPGAFVLAGFYSETTAFALTVATFYYARTGRWPVAVVLGFLTALTRLQALAILAPLAYEFWRQRGIRWQALCLGLIPLGTLAFVLYLWHVTGSPWTLFSDEKTAWFRTPILPWEQVGIALDRALWPRNHYITSVNLLDAGSTLLFIGLTVWSVFKMPPAYWLYGVPVLIAALSTTIDPAKAPPTSSVTRYLMAVFPAYIALGRIAKNAFVDQCLRWTFAFLLAVFAIYFFSRNWVL